MHVPERVVTNDELATYVDTSDEWIRERTGIRERRMVGPDEAMSDLSLPASRRALEMAGIDPATIDLVIVATVTADMSFPSTAALLADALGMPDAAAYDLSAGCTGFMYALVQGYGMVASGLSRRALVVGGDVLSRILDWEDRGTCVLFGDGAGALVLRAVSEAAPGGRFILSTHLHSDGRLYDILYVDGGPSSSRSTGFLRMEGREVFRQAVQHLSAVIEEALAANGLTVADVDWLVPHQANGRIIEGVGRKLGLSQDKVVSTIERHANTSAASIPLALEVAVGDGRIKPGDLVLMEALGGGLTWAARLVRW